MNRSTSREGNSKQKSLNTEVPSLGNPDRKRALNVLAQRRYSMFLQYYITAANAYLHDISDFAELTLRRTTKTE